MPQAMAGDETMALTQMRRAIANAMVTSKTTIPHAAAMMEIDWTSVAKFRESVREQFKSREGYELTYLPFAIKAVTIALRRHPLVNARWTDQGIVIQSAAADDFNAIDPAIFQDATDGSCWLAFGSFWGGPGPL